MKKTDETVNLFNLNIFSNTKNQLLKKLIKHLQRATGSLIIFTPNPEQIMLAKRDDSFASVLGFADILVPDGIGLVLAAKLQALFGQNQQAITQRITGIDLANQLIAIAKKQDRQVLLLGGRDYQPQARSQSLQQLELKGKQIHWLPAYQDVTQPTRAEQQQVARQIEQLQPDIVFVAFGAPHQEKWVYQYQELLKKSQVKLVLVVGGAFDMLLGKINRAPQWWQNLGLEWLYRLIKQPWRIKRQRHLIGFVGLMFKNLVTGKA